MRAARRDHRHTQLLPAIVLLAALGLSGCGHRASVEECEEIIERIARLEIEKHGKLDPKEVASQVEQTKKGLRETTMKDCVGKRITSRAMECVRKAKSSEALVEECFD